MSNTWINLLGLARRAGQLVAGAQTVAAAISRGRVALLIVASDLSAASQKKLARLAQAHGVRMIVALDRHRLGLATNYPGRGVFGVTSKDFAQAILSSWQHLVEGGVHHS